MNVVKLQVRTVSSSFKLVKDVSCESNVLPVSLVALLRAVRTVRRVKPVRPVWFVFIVALVERDVAHRSMNQSRKLWGKRTKNVLPIPSKK